MKPLRPIFMQSQKCSLKYGLPGLTVLRRCVKACTCSWHACLHACNIGIVAYNFTMAMVLETVNSAVHLELSLFADQGLQSIWH